MALELNGTTGVSAVQTGAVESGDLPVEAYQKNNILGTVSESSGVPTGAIIERGSNANGEFVRYADGTQMTTTRTVFNFSGFASFDVTLPASFHADREYHVSVSRAQSGTSSNIDAKIGCFANNKSTARFQLPSGDAGGGTFNSVVFA